ncbi:PREDICTED: PRUPE_5G199800 [Prunus dulcis]|uniref:PREDICTED: PRUPE_5G199800 n=1 Tax=Prunus dulcis TaxID=3755 RepID=A0A5E4GG68_PRUDU|nr:PREDICTED: PRUPE_5G199800 [Prunus dulcis]
MTATSPIMSTETVIDLKASVIVETDLVGEDSVQTKCKEHLDLPHDGLIRVAAEALVSISSSQGHDMQNSAAHHLQESATFHEMDASENDSLPWFAELISSHEGNHDNENVSEVKPTTHDEDDVMDFLEHMTLNLVETKVEKYCYVPPNQENPREEMSLPKRPRRGQARRSWQRKDFQSSLTLRNAGRSGKGRGGKRMGTSTPFTTEVAVSQPQIEESKWEESCRT